MTMKKRHFLRILIISALLLLSGCGKKRDGEIGEGPYSCTLSVDCGNLLVHLADLDPEKVELVPADGIILPPTTVHFTEGESAFDVLLKAALHDKIHLEYSESPLYHSMYIEGINNLYEFDAGALSGWMYSVNGEFPGFGSSAYRLSDGDVVRFLFTCDLGEDLGNSCRKQANPPVPDLYGISGARKRFLSLLNDLDNLNGIFAGADPRDALGNSAEELIGNGQLHL